MTARVSTSSSGLACAERRASLIGCEAGLAWPASDFSGLLLVFEVLC